jgi:hypothetical protein
MKRGWLFTGWKTRAFVCDRHKREIAYYMPSRARIDNAQYIAPNQYAFDDSHSVRGIIQVGQAALADNQDAELEHGGSGMLVDITDSNSGRVFHLRMMTRKEGHRLLHMFDFRAAASRRWKRWIAAVRLANAFKKGGRDRLERLRDPIFQAGFGTYADTPEEFICPITCVLLQDPVIAADGITYEREAISRWLQQSSKSPCLNTELENKELRPNQSLRQLMRDMAERGRKRTAHASLTHMWRKRVMGKKQIGEEEVVCGVAKSTAAPSEFIGPITGLLLRDPVVAADGVTYEREAIMRMMQQSLGTDDDGSNCPLEPSLAQLRPNTTLRKLIESTAESGRCAYQQELRTTHTHTHGATDTRTW